MNDAQVYALSALVQLYSKDTVQACQDIIAENGKITNPLKNFHDFYLAHNHTRQLNFNYYMVIQIFI